MDCALRKHLIKAESPNPTSIIFQGLVHPASAPFKSSATAKIQKINLNFLVLKKRHGQSSLCFVHVTMMSSWLNIRGATRETTNNKIKTFLELKI